jgi:adenylate cyclase class 2
MLEIEKKYRLSQDRWNGIVALLKEIGADFVGEDFEENTIYSGEALENTGGIVRIRRTQDRALLTFKRRIEDQTDVKKQLEYETEVLDPDAAADIIAELGLRPKLVYEKRRKTWRFQKTVIALDELPFGLFMEIEGSITGIKQAEMLLELDDIKTEHETYPRLTSRLGKQIGEKIEARFN